MVKGNPCPSNGWQCSALGPFFLHPEAPHGIMLTGKEDPAWADRRGLDKVTLIGLTPADMETLHWRACSRWKLSGC